MHYPDPNSIQRMIEQGGPIVIVLIVLSIAALTVTLLKSAQFLRLGVGRERKAVTTAVSNWRAGRYSEAMQSIAKQTNTVAALIKTAMGADHNIGEAPRSQALIREEIEARALSHLSNLRSYLRVLEATAQLAPLIGLFGTVIGMMSAFQALQSSGAEADPTALAGGIWTALITTAVGLAIAIPAAFALYWFEGRIAREQTLIETAVTSVLTAPSYPSTIQVQSRHTGAGLPNAAE